MCVLNEAFDVHLVKLDVVREGEHIYGCASVMFLYVIDRRVGVL